MMKMMMMMNGELQLMMVVENDRPVDAQDCDPLMMMMMMMMMMIGYAKEAIY
jgi:hypothetical protein